MQQESTSNPKSALSKSLKIGVLCGGKSSERKISLRSGRAVHRALARAGFSSICLDPGKASHMQKALSRMDIAFIALHGRGGEDGVIQKTLERRRIPYIGSGPAGSKRAFDKVIAKKIFLKTGIPTPPFVILRKNNWKSQLKRFALPFFVKPIREGSSIGAFGVEDLSKSAENIEQALDRYGELLVEKKIQGREFTVGIFGGKALPVVELKPKREFYDYRAKYTKGMTVYEVPAVIPAVLRNHLQKIGLAAHRALGLRDFSRVDVMVDESGHPYVLEANSIPGFTEFSLLPKAARAAGISFEELCSKLVGWAYQRGKKENLNGKKKKKKQ